MSVINKMLRDLDNRQQAGGVQDPASGLRPDFARGTSTVSPSGLARPSMPRRNLSIKWVAVAALLGVGGAVWWYLPRPVPGLVTAPPAANALQPVFSPAALPGNPPGTLPAVAAIPEVPAKASAPNSAFTLKMDTQARLSPHLFRTDNPPVKANSERVNPDATRSAITPRHSDAAIRVASASSTLQSPVANSPVLVSNGVVSSISAGAVVNANSAAQRQAAAGEALSQAQALWTAGSREAAIELMSEAVTVAERGANPAGSTVLVSLVRELARMELAEGQVIRVLDMLTRLEPAIAGQADLWAVRGNAAQRLGRHQDSANAYLRALGLRPEEPRWMLGAAVSLAAQGQTVAAMDLAEKARTRGAVSREVAAYLRQLGVPLRDQ